LSSVQLHLVPAGNEPPSGLLRSFSGRISLRRSSQPLRPVGRLLRGVAYAAAGYLLELDGQDWRPRTLDERKERLKRLLASAPAGIQYSQHLEGDGAAIFAHACRLAEGIVSKHRAHPYRSGPSKAWLGVRGASGLRVRSRHISKASDYSFAVRRRIKARCACFTGLTDRTCPIAFRSAQTATVLKDRNFLPLGGAGAEKVLRNGQVS
jgi:hypothetical protein